MEQPRQPIARLLDVLNNVNGCGEHKPQDGTSGEATPPEQEPPQEEPQDTVATDSSATEQDSENEEDLPDWFLDIIAALEDTSTVSEPDQTDLSFDIDIVYRGDVSDSLILSVARAKARWESVILNDLADQDDIDDIRIEVIETDTLQAGYVGWSQPLAIRDSREGGLPRMRVVFRFRLILCRRGHRVLDALVLHEIGHALGFGTIPRFRVHRKYNLFVGYYYTGPSCLVCLAGDASGSCIGRHHLIERWRSLARLAHR